VVTILYKMTFLGPFGTDMTAMCLQLVYRFAYYLVRFLGF
jgi:hypothetical protein